MDSNENVTNPIGDERSGDSVSSRVDELSKKERRRNQNRHNQQVWRSRQKAEKEFERNSQNQARVQEQRIYQPQSDIGAGPGLIPDFTLLSSFIQEQHTRNETKAGDRLRSPEIIQLMHLFESAAHCSYMGNPNTDHRLTLVKLNVFRAFVGNITALGYTREWMTDEALSRFSVLGPHPGPPQRDIPASLQPTSLQQSQPHHPWLDFFPFANLRDILIVHEYHMDDVQLCRDLMGFHTMPSEQDNCMLVWGDPWNPMNWEVTETFLKKWGWLIKGCPEIIWSTNHWRRMRGQRRIRWRNSFKNTKEKDLTTKFRTIV